MDKFDVFLSKMQANEPFCLVRFNDGEMMGVEKVGAKVARGDQIVNQSLSDALIEGLSYKAEGYWIGTPCPVCWEVHAKLADSYVGEYENKTCAVVLTNENWQRCRELLDAINGRPVVIISGTDQNWKDLLAEHGVNDYEQYTVPLQDAWAYKDSVMGLINDFPAGAVVFISCGPLSRVLAHKWWVVRQDCTLLDVGSTYDPFTRGVKHNCHKWSNGRNRTKWCRHCNKKGKFDATRAFDRDIDYDTYKQIYIEEERDENWYPTDEAGIREALDSCFYGERQKKRNKKIVHCWGGDVKPSGKGLELAFGFGTSLKWLTSRFDVVMDGIDFADYVQTLIPYFREDMGDKIGELWQGDVANIEKPDEHYDFINSCSVFEHLPDIVYYDCLKECYRILKPGGLMAVFLDSGPPHGEHLRMDPPEVTRKDMEAVGFEAITDYLYRKL